VILAGVLLKKEEEGVKTIGHHFNQDEIMFWTESTFFWNLKHDIGLADLRSYLRSRDMAFIGRLQKGLLWLERVPQKRQGLSWTLKDEWHLDRKRDTRKMLQATEMVHVNALSKEYVRSDYKILSGLLYWRTVFCRNGMR
jgi:hypothetical protein